MSDCWTLLQLDAVYIRVLGVLSRTLQSGDVPIDSASLRTYSDLIAFHVAASENQAVLAAFQSFWNSTFGTVAGLDFDEDLKDFLRSFMDTDSQFLIVPGLELVSQESQNVSSCIMTL
jgi:hypothetical protein